MSTVEARIGRIANSKMFIDGEEFTLPEMASRMPDEEKSQVEYALELMVERRLLSLRLDSSRMRHYSRMGPDLMRMDWRVDKSVYNMVDELMRGW